MLLFCGTSVGPYPVAGLPQKELYTRDLISGRGMEAGVPLRHGLQDCAGAAQYTPPEHKLTDQLVSVA